ncbi:MAG: electron transfer flavoprotein subunit alpha/FixB family protein [Candidatus Hatepunaea meridiana]|nr:electron transfer flavoprotein subunit alpha/FixB family protein [Candidatus Hatepunaea meridiana]
MDILVYVETRDNQIKPAGLEAISGARKLADVGGGKLTALLIGTSLSELTGEVEKYGVDRILLAEYPEFAGYTPEGYREAIIAAVEETDAKVVVMTATSLGRDLAPVAAAKLDASLLPDCTSIEYIEGKISVTRPVYAGKCIITLTANSSPLVLSLRPKAFLVSERNGKEAEVSKLDVSLEGKIRARLVETRSEAGGKLDVTEADIIVAGGRGMKAKENFKLIEDLADELGGAVGASRAVVDNDWRPHSEQVGQTGKVVAPTLYIAAGISGAIQHLAGMRSSKVIVAINKDADATVFKSADYGIVGDAMEVLPALLEAVKE